MSQLNQIEMKHLNLMRSLSIQNTSRIVTTQLTAIDSIAETQMGGNLNVYPDAMHCVEGGPPKHLVLGIKTYCARQSSLSIYRS